MSLGYSDIYELGVESDCCGASVYLNGICSNCNDHCTPLELEEPDRFQKGETMDKYRDIGMSPGDFFKEDV
tara:strand:+ start:52 stop:264 length:213 start_codon:yes stop_codon:yes gene_type:complete